MNKNSHNLFTEKQFQASYQNLNRPIIVADHIRTPENMGMIIRLAANINALKVLFIIEGDPVFKKYKINRAASGATKKVNWQIVNLNKLEYEIPDDYHIIALETSNDAVNIFDFTLPAKPAFIIGNEVNGISEELLSRAEKKVFIPVPGTVSSLNVTHALSIGLFEWLSQMTTQE